MHSEPQGNYQNRTCVQFSEKHNDQTNINHLVYKLMFKDYPLALITNKKVNMSDGLNIYRIYEYMYIVCVVCTTAEPFFVLFLVKYFFLNVITLHKVNPSHEIKHNL